MAARKSEPARIHHLRIRRVTLNHLPFSLRWPNLDREVSHDFDRSPHTFTFESLFYEAKEHLTTKVTKCRRSVGVDRQKVWSNNCFILGNFCYKTSGIEKFSSENTVNPLLSPPLSSGGKLINPPSLLSPPSPSPNPYSSQRN